MKYPYLPVTVDYPPPEVIDARKRQKHGDVTGYCLNGNCAAEWMENMAHGHNSCPICGGGGVFHETYVQYIQRYKAMKKEERERR